MPKSDKKRSRVHGLGPTPTGAAGGKGQHFLKNMAVVSKIVEKAKLKSTDVALEIGVGTGIGMGIAICVGIGVCVVVAVEKNGKGKG